MKIYGIERHFKLTVGAYREIARLLPDGNIEGLGSLLSGNDAMMMMQMIFNLRVIMSKWAEKQETYEKISAGEDPKQVIAAMPRPLSVEELETLPMEAVLGSLKDEVIQAFIDSQNTEIPLKKTEMTEGTEED